MACKYCDWFSDDHEELVNTRTKLSKKTDKYPGIYACIDREANLYIEAVADTYEPSYLEHSIKINFCPMCGRELREKE